MLTSDASGTSQYLHLDASPESSIPWLQASEDYIVCGKCMSRFKLSEYSKFRMHKQNDCQVHVEEDGSSPSASNNGRF